MGPRWMAYRLWYGLRQKTGALQRAMPLRDWSDAPLQTWLPAGEAGSFGQRWLDSPPAFFQSAEQLTTLRGQLAAWDTKQTAVLRSDQLAAGQWDVFGTRRQDTFPPRWLCEPGSDQPFPSDHWATLNEFAYGDIKRVWEPARFSSAFAFVRADVQSGGASETHAERFWQLLESFHYDNPPNHGPHWKCGQECAMRIMACCFAVYGFRKHAATTALRVEKLAQLAAATAERIQHNIQYALHQYNNHGISEAAGLFTVGLLFPQFQQSSKWVTLGKQLLEQQAKDLIYDDGAFSQHSANYHRLMLQLMVWCAELGKRHNQTFDSPTLDRLKRTTDFLWKLQDSVSGQLPNYGQNDGALLLPLSACEPRDYRPAIQSASIAFHNERRYESGPWDEEATWIHGDLGSLNAASHQPRPELAGGMGGCHTMRSGRGMAVIRCTPSYRHRPAHCDPLHVDLWWKGLNIAIDPGTYSYNSPPPWDHPLADAAYHNTVTVDGQSPMERTSRFLYTPWIKGRVIEHSRQHEVGLWEGTQAGYRRRGLQDAPATAGHRRAVVRLGEDHWLVADDLRSQAEHEYRLHWLFSETAHQWDTARQTLTLDTNEGMYQVHTVARRYGELEGRSNPDLQTVGELVTADPETARGWQAPLYGHRRPALSLSVECHAANVQFLTVLGPPLGGDLELHFASDPSQLLVQTGEARYAIHLAPAPDGHRASNDTLRLVASAGRVDASESSPHIAESTLPTGRVA